MSKYILEPDHPFMLHSMLLKMVFKDWDANVKVPKAIPEFHEVGASRISRS